MAVQLVRPTKLPRGSKLLTVTTIRLEKVCLLRAMWGRSLVPLPKAVVRLGAIKWPTNALLRGVTLLAGRATKDIAPFQSGDRNGMGEVLFTFRGIGPLEL